MTEESEGAGGWRDRVEGTAWTTAIIFSVCHDGEKKGEKEVDTTEDLERAFRLLTPLAPDRRISTYVRHLVVWLLNVRAPGY